MKLYNVPQVNLGGLLAWEFLLFHWVELRRWQDIQNHHSVDQDPIFKNNRVHLPFPFFMGLILIPRLSCLLKSTQMQLPLQRFKPCPIQ